ncbi:phosphoglycerate mutase-like protein [Laetiporus sulphureus 93-53]|uniref:Phosphoglycerate mutase-like protein n=1 Tax=Laetiporus sulphureus 93-53 TaxID=1314785 RepID=A0A165D230_9APHY|nr:phosphoglycerate mutase-like protein [Laetiporus sulphureus 93-53]KZT04001.1 phosphoglycerate mutase-like protein [Laetiporus sulphureus 93-53]
MSHREVLGVVVLARNGDRTEAYQDPITYQPGPTLSTPLGEAQAHQLGQFLRETYLNSENPSHIRGISAELVDLSQVHVRVKVGSEGPSVFDSATALLQGLFPPNPANRITLANGTTIVAPLGGYQYVPVETVEPTNDRSLESWTDCPAFDKHVEKVQKSQTFKKLAEGAQRFLNDVRDFVFGTEVSVENAYNVWDYINTELTHNKTYAHRLPPTYIDQARSLANTRETLVFSDPQLAGVGNIAARTVLHSILGALQRVAYNDDPLQFMLIETTYQPFISLFHMTGVLKAHPELVGIPNYASALAIELRRGRAPDVRDFLRFKFKNGTQDEDFETVHVFDHGEDIPLTEFIYYLENSVINSNREWAKACGVSSSSWFGIEGGSDNSFVNAGAGALLAVVMMFGLWLVSRSVRNLRRRNYVRLEGDDVSCRTHLSRVALAHNDCHAQETTQVHNEKAMLLQRA